MASATTPLRKLREERGLTTIKVARELSIDQGHYSRIERDGKCSKEVAEKIVDFFGREWITELHVLYPERYRVNGQRQAA
jgi:transcriptional regulator with XRE-family HTH domain